MAWGIIMKICWVLSAGSRKRKVGKRAKDGGDNGGRDATCFFLRPQKCGRKHVHIPCTMKHNILANFITNTHTIFLCIGLASFTNSYVGVFPM